MPNVMSRAQQSFNANKSQKHLHRFVIHRNHFDAVHSTINTNAMFRIITIRQLARIPNVSLIIQKILILIVVWEGKKEFLIRSM